jgi:hypothetical protein
MRLDKSPSQENSQWLLIDLSTLNYRCGGSA